MPTPDPTTTTTAVDTGSSGGSTDPSTGTTTQDDGSSSSGPSSSGSSETGDPEPACGDGVVAADELCHQLGPVIVVDPAPMEVAWGDLNGDGPVDLVLANPMSNLLTVLYGVGDGNFVAPQTLLDLGTPIHDLVLEDFSGDGWLDVVVTDWTNSQIISHANDGAGGLFFAGQYPIDLAPVRLTAGLVDGDATPDLVAIAFNSLQVLHGNGLAGFLPDAVQSVPNGPHRADIVDLDADGLFDLLTVNQGGGNTTCFLNIGEVFQDGLNHDTANAPLGQAIGDIDEDGALDLLVTHASSDNVGILLGDGTGALGAEMLMGVDDDPRSVVLTDLDLDGHLDLVTAHTAPNLVVVRRGLGDGTFDVGPSFETESPSYLWPAQLNGDGVGDVIVARLADATLQMLVSDP